MIRLLLVEDDPNVRECLVSVLEFGGYGVTPAEDGEQALRIAREEFFDGVVLDLILPKKGGLEILPKLRENLPGAAILAISGGGHVPASDLFQAARRLGADAVLEKPFKPAQLLEALGLAFEQRQFAAHPGERVFWNTAVASRGTEAWI